MGVGTRDWPGHSNPNKAPRSHTIPPLRSAGWRDLRWELQAPPFPGRTFPAHTQRLWALQRAAPGHRPLSLLQASCLPLHCRSNVYPPRSSKGPSGAAWQQLTGAITNLMLLNLRELNLGNKKCGGMRGTSRHLGELGTALSAMPGFKLLDLRHELWFL